MSPACCPSHPSSRSHGHLLPTLLPAASRPRNPQLGPMCLLNGSGTGQGLRTWGWEGGRFGMWFLALVLTGSSPTPTPFWASVSLPAERLRGPTKILDLRKMGSALREPHTRISLLLRVTSHVRDPLAPPIPQATDQEGSLCPQSVPLAISSYPQGKLWPGDRAWSPCQRTEHTQLPRNWRS